MLYIIENRLFESESEIKEIDVKVIDKKTIVKKEENGVVDYTYLNPTPINTENESSYISDPLPSMV